MAETSEKTVQQINDGASSLLEEELQEKVDGWIKSFIDEKDYYPAVKAKKFRSDGKFTEDETDSFVREFALNPSKHGKRLDLACDIIEENHSSVETKEWLLQYSIELGCMDTVRRVKALLINRDLSQEEIRKLDNAVRKKHRC